MQEAVDTTENFEVDPFVTHVFVSIVFIAKFLRDVAEIDADIFGEFQWSLEVKVSDFKN